MLGALLTQVRKDTIWFFVALMCFASSSFSRDNPLPGSRFESVRGAALADSLFTFAEDGSALFYNPAGIAKAKGSRLEPLALQGHVNPGWLQTVGLDSYKIGALSAWAPTLVANPGVTTGAGYSIFPNFITRGFALGVLFQSSVLASASADGSTITYTTKREFVPTAGFGVRLASGVVRLGYSLQYVNQAAGSATVSAADSSLAYSSGVSVGSAFAHQAGFALSLPISFLPSFTFVGRNLFGTQYNSASTLVPLGTDSVGLPTEEPMTFDAGMSLEPKLGSGGAAILLMGCRDLWNRSGSGLLNRVTLGLEYQLRGFLALRLGYASGNLSLGLGFLGKKADLSLAWFHQPIGTSVSDLGEYRLQMGYSLRAF